jgi:hypothetical protein
LFSLSIKLKYWSLVVKLKYWSLVVKLKYWSLDVKLKYWSLDVKLKYWSLDVKETINCYQLLHDILKETLKFFFSETTLPFERKLR